MADNYLITGYWGEPHVTAENDRGIHAGIFGTGRFVLPVGEQFRAEYIGNNTVRMYDGKLMDGGAAAGIPAGQYVDLLIPNASQGMRRNDLIVFQYSIDQFTMIESGVFIAIHGTETSGTAVDPSLTKSDLLSGNAKLDQFAMWRIPVVGATISAPVKLFEVSRNIKTANENANSAKAGVEAANKNASEAKTSVDEHIENKANPHCVTKSQVGLGNVPNVTTDNQTPTHTTASTLAALTSGETLKTAFGKIAKAITELISHLSNKNNPHGVSASQIGAATAAAVQTAQTTANEAKSLATGALNTANSKANEHHYQDANTIRGGTFGGQVVANASSQNHSTILLRNCAILPDEAVPSNNGEICWQYK